ncbi:MAG: tetratricopeptide repeat protein [Bacteroidota bacterium]
MQQKPTKQAPGTTDMSQQMTIRIKRHQQRLYAVGLIILIGTVGFFFFRRHQDQQNEVAQAEMFQAVYYFEREAFDKALDGDGACVGLLAIAKEYRFTKAANLANFYIGVSYMHQKDYEKAIRHLTKFKAKDLLLKARAWVLIGDALTAQQAYKKAAQHYIKAANYHPNKVFTPIYLGKAALAHEANKDIKAALSCYQRIVRDFPDTTQYGEAVKHVARLETIKKHRSKQVSEK